MPPHPHRTLCLVVTHSNDEGNLLWLFTLYLHLISSQFRSTLFTKEVNNFEKSNGSMGESFQD